MVSLIRFLFALQQNVFLNKEVVRVRNSKLVMEFVQLLYVEGVVLRCNIRSNSLEIYLRRRHGRPIMRGVKLVSSVGKEVFYSLQELKLLRDVGFYIVSTVEGIMTHKEAVLRGLGGKVFCFIMV